MASCRLLIKASAARELESLPLRHARRVAKRIRESATDPRAPGAEKLSGRDLYRVRQGDYRVVYEISEADRTVTVVRIGHRREIYR